MVDNEFSLPDWVKGFTEHSFSSWNVLRRETLQQLSSSMEAFPRSLNTPAATAHVVKVIPACATTRDATSIEFAVLGRNFENSPKLSCFFGPLSVRVKYFSNTALVVSVPKGLFVPTGNVEVSVSNTGTGFTGETAWIAFSQDATRLPKKVPSGSLSYHRVISEGAHSDRQNVGNEVHVHPMRSLPLRLVERTCYRLYLSVAPTISCLRHAEHILRHVITPFSERLSRLGVAVVVLTSPTGSLLEVALGVMRSKHPSVVQALECQWQVENADIFIAVAPSDALPDHVEGMLSPDVLQALDETSSWPSKLEPRTLFDVEMLTACLHDSSVNSHLQRNKRKRTCLILHAEEIHAHTTHSTKNARAHYSSLVEAARVKGIDVTESFHNYIDTTHQSSQINENDTSGALADDPHFGIHVRNAESFLRRLVPEEGDEEVSTMSSIWALWESNQDSFFYYYTRGTHEELSHYTPLHAHVRSGRDVSSDVGSSSPLVLHGAPGCGKTVFLANWCSRRTSEDGDIVIWHSTRVSPSHTNPLVILLRIVWKLWGVLENKCVPVEWVEDAWFGLSRDLSAACDSTRGGLLATWLGVLLRQAVKSTGRRVLVVLDAAEMTDTTAVMAILPDPLPPNVYVFLSMSTSKWLEISHGFRVYPLGSNESSLRGSADQSDLRRRIVAHVCPPPTIGQRVSATGAWSRLLLSENEASQHHRARFGEGSGTASGVPPDATIFALRLKRLLLELSPASQVEAVRQDILGISCDQLLQRVLRTMEKTFDALIHRAVPYAVFRSSALSPHAIASSKWSGVVKPSGSAALRRLLVGVYVVTDGISDEDAVSLADVPVEATRVILELLSGVLLFRGTCGYMFSSEYVRCGVRDRYIKTSEDLACAHILLAGHIHIQRPTWPTWRLAYEGIMACVNAEKALAVIRGERSEQNAEEGGSTDDVVAVLSSISLLRTFASAPGKIMLLALWTATGMTGSAADLYTSGLRDASKKFPRRPEETAERYRGVSCILRMLSQHDGAKRHLHLASVVLKTPMRAPVPTPILVRAACATARDLAAACVQSGAYPEALQHASHALKLSYCLPPDSDSTAIIHRCEISFAAVLLAMAKASRILSNLPHDAYAFLSSSESVLVHVPCAYEEKSTRTEESLLSCSFNDGAHTRASNQAKPPEDTTPPSPENCRRDGKFAATQYRGAGATTNSTGVEGMGGHEADLSPGKPNGCSDPNTLGSTHRGPAFAKESADALTELKDLDELDDLDDFDDPPVRSDDNPSSRVLPHSAGYRDGETCGKEDSAPLGALGAGSAPSSRGKNQGLLELEKLLALDDLLCPPDTPVNDFEAAVQPAARACVGGGGGGG
eukprot:Rmarinus@m.24304